MTQMISGLDELAEYADWTHQSQRCYPGEPLFLLDACLKWYDIRLDDQTAAPEVHDEAREYLRAQAAAGVIPFRKEFGFVLMHRYGEKFYMRVCVWRNKREMWQGLFYKHEEGFLPYPVKPGLIQPTQSIIELDATAHERRSWSRFLRSARDRAAKQAYLDDLCTGELV
jgi:hypothetical protein